MQFFRIKFSKIAKCWGLFITQSSVIFDAGELSCVIWTIFVYFLTDYEEIEVYDSFQ